MSRSPGQSTKRPGSVKYRFALFEADFRAGQLSKAGYRLRLTGQPLRVLEMLLERPGDLVSREELQRRLWPADTFVDFEHNLNSAVKRLRAALGDSAGAPRYIETLPRRGYRFIAPVDVVITSVGPTPIDPVPAVVVEPVIAPSPNEAIAAPAQERRRWSWVAAAAALIVLVSMAAAAMIYRGNAASLPINSLAVLPLTYRRTGAAADDYLADGLTGALIAELSKLNGLRVISETSSSRYRGERTKSLPEIARELGVDGIIEGSVAREGEIVRVTVQLIHAATDSHMWANTYTRGVGSALTLQSEVASDIVHEIGTQIAPDERTRMVAGRPVNPAAYRLYVLGHRLWQRETEPELYAALDHFERALAIDPTLARAHWGIAETWISLGTWAAYLPPREGMPRAKAAALKAIELDPSLAEAHSALAFVTEVFDWDLPAAETMYRSALALSPNDALTHRRFSLFLNRTRRRADGVKHAQRAFELDPLSIENNISLGQRLYAEGKRDEAVAALVRATELDPSHFHPWVHLAEIYKFMGRVPDAIDAAERAMTLSNGGVHAAHMLASIYARGGDRARAEALLEPFEAPSARINPYDAGMFYLDLGRHEKALHWLRRACDARTPQMAFFHLAHTTPVFAPLRTDPRFGEIVACASADVKPIAN